MKKALSLIIVFAMILPFILGACGKKEEESKASTTAKEETTTPQEAATKEDSGQQSQDESLWAELSTVVNDLVSRVNQLNKIDACDIQSDPSVTYTDDKGFTYELVTDPAFTSIGDIANYLADTFTAAGASYHYPYLYDMSSTTPSPYIYVQDGLYKLPVGKGATIFKIISEIEFTEVGDDHFTASFDAEVLGTIEKIRLSVSKDEDMWKVNAIDIVE